ncbi:MAG: hypothetical protein K8R50_03285 [Betaproteobacteria bacterium]|nr:hypothetical protein [Betaproteobacteria bacterium]
MDSPRDLVLTPLELISKIAALTSPPPTIRQVEGNRLAADSISTAK